MCNWICARQNGFPCVWKNIILLSILQQGFRGTLVFHKTSGVSRVWPAWHVPWAQISVGRKNCLAQIKILFTVSWTSILRPTQPYIAKLRGAPISNVLSRTCCVSSTKHYDKTAVLWHNTTAKYCDTLWHNKNARLPHLLGIVLLTV